MSEKLIEFRKLFHAKMKEKVPIQTEWVTVKSIDWEAKTMVAIGELNNLEYFDVVLGLGSVVIKPKIGSLALVGAIHNGEGCFMISCEEMDGFEITDATGFKVSLNSGLLVINGDEFGGIVNAKELKEQLDKNTLILEKMQKAFEDWIPIANDGGAALKAKSAMFVDLPRTELENIENPKIKHGNGS